MFNNKNLMVYSIIYNYNDPIEKNRKIIKLKK